MEIYLYPISTALLHFWLAAFYFTTPYIFFNYYKYGSVSFYRSIIIFTFAFYMLCAFYLTILPLPDPAKVKENVGPFTQFIPFYFIYDFFKNTSFNIHNFSSVIRIFTKGVFLQPLFNTILLLPFGIYLSYYFKRNFKQVFFLTALLSLFYETTQITGLYGIYEKPYRIFDVDDIILNTFGGVLGYFIGTYISKILPDREAIDKANFQKGMQVGYIRRYFAGMVDFNIVMLFSSILYYQWFPITKDYINPIAFLGYFVLLPVFTRGKTLGKMLVRIRVVTVDSTKPLIFHLLIKYGLVYCLYVLLSLVIQMITKLNSWPLLLYLFAMAMIWLLLFIDWTKSFRGEKRLWYERLSHTKNESSLPPFVMP